MENEALEQNQALSCTDLVKLDSNYGSCNVSIVNGKGTVTLVGANKFAGITCTGTKDNMNCSEGSSNAPEYVYSLSTRPLPHYDYAVYLVTDVDACIAAYIDVGFDEEYATSVCNGNGYDGETTNDILTADYSRAFTYTVKEGKKQECKTYLENKMINEWNYPSEDVQSEAEVICSNSNDISGDGNGLPMTTSDWFAEAIYWGALMYSDISSFVEYNNIFDTFTERRYELIDGVTDYTELNKDVFYRWSANTITSATTSVCTLYGGDTTCFSSEDSYTVNANKMRELYGSSNCEDGIIETPHANYIMCSINNGSTCGMNSLGEICCKGDNLYSCSNSERSCSTSIDCMSTVTALK